jgi:hypothetical protein
MIFRTPVSGFGGKSEENISKNSYLTLTLQTGS